MPMEMNVQILLKILNEPNYGDKENDICLSMDPNGHFPKAKKMLLKCMQKK